MLFAFAVVLIAVSLVGVVMSAGEERTAAHYVSAFMSFAEGMLCLYAGSLCATAGYHREGGRSLGASPRRVRQNVSPAPRIGAVAVCAAMSAVHIALIAIGAATFCAPAVAALILQAFFLVVALPVFARSAAVLGRR